MSHLYTAQVEWKRSPLEDFTDNRYSRRHRLRFDGGAELAASSSPSVVPLPMFDAGAVDPEELFVAALASCHMLWFLSLAAERGWRVDRYADEATGLIGRNAQGRVAMECVALRPAVQFSGLQPPGAADIDALHRLAHERCYIANSVSCEVRCEPAPAAT